MFSFLKRSHAHADLNPAHARVYRIQVSGGMSQLGMLIAVCSPDPADTIHHYLDHAAVEVHGEPVLLSNLDGTAGSIDQHIKAKSTAPYYEIMNMKAIHPIDRGLVDEDR